ncbi:hypothetical protein [Lentibacillus saliphilus]|uniref:hypothetical protein n=1 Tax=Lentibacillus saliphilus TaxID=2737028 RepID=UPI001C2FA86F|nr:hypothetical protein [Lentibacillus saliphilus]
MRRIGGLLIVVILLLGGCDLSQVHHNMDLQNDIHAVMTSKDEDTIDLGSMIDFEWDEAFLFTPYTPKSTIKNEVGLKDPSGISYRDDIQLLVFVKDETPIEYVEIAREYGDVTRPNQFKLVPSNDQLRINRNES